VCSSDLYIGGVALGVNQDNYVTVDGNPIITVNTAGNITIQGDSILTPVAVSDTAPDASVSEGNLWYNTLDGRTYVSYSSQWVDTNPVVVPPPETYLGNIAIDGDTLNINGSTLTISNTGTLLVNGQQVISGNNQTIYGATLTASATDPLTSTGTLWFNTVEGRTYLKYNDQWVDVNPTVVPLPSTYLDEITIDGSTINMNGSTLAINTAGVLLVNGEEVTGSGSGWELTSSTAVVSLASDGVLTLPNGGTIFDTGPGGGWLAIAPANAGLGQALVLYPTQQDGNHIHLTANGNDTDLYLGNDDQYVKIDHSGDIVVGTYSTATTSTWTFGTDGVLTLSTASTILGNGEDPNVYIETATTSTTSTWSFGTDGVLTLPADTPIIKGGGTGTDVTVIATTGSNTATWVFGATGTITFPDATVQRTAYLSGQQTVYVNTASTTTSINLTELTGSVIIIQPEAGYTTTGETHDVYIPFQFMEFNPSIPLGTRITVINLYSGTVNFGGWPGPGYSMNQSDSIDLVYYYDENYGGNLWWITNTFSW
jgi:hypothetical protein